MTNIGFIGIGNMGAPMARNLIDAGLNVTVFDLSESACAAFGDQAAPSSAQAIQNKDIIITMLPKGEHVQNAYLGEDGILAHAKPGTLLIDCSTIDVETARGVIQQATDKGLEMVDAPVSGGVGGAEAASLTFMVGGTDEGFQRAKPVLTHMGKSIIHAGPAGNGQVAKICNNMMLAIQMVSICEGFALAEKLGLDAQTLFDITSTASAQCWSLTSYCPVPGPVPAAPSNKDYAPGFTVNNMLKDLLISQNAAKHADIDTALGAAVTKLYEQFATNGNENLDFSGIIQQINTNN